MTDAFGKVPSWHLPPGSVIPADRQYMNKPNAVFLSSHPNLSIRTQAKEHLDGIEDLKILFLPRITCTSLKLEAAQARR